MMKLVLTRADQILCPDCADILAEENLQGRYHVYNQRGLEPISVLQKGVLQGCPICGIVLVRIFGIAPDSVSLEERVERKLGEIESHAITLDVKTRNSSGETSHARYILNYSLYYDGSFFNHVLHLAPALSECTSGFCVYKI
jgi:hypothetical protein